MSYTVDLHTHSRFSRACSNKLNIPNLTAWAKLKGIDVLGTGDFLHPLWLSELKQDLKDDGSGFLYHDLSGIKFVLTVEISSIYSHRGNVRRVHNIVIVSSFNAAEKLQKKLLERKANLSADGRPIVGISSKDLLRLCLEIDEKSMLIPAHAWTPWFGVFGSQSGYDSLQECFEDLTEYIYGIETGLSSDPAMNWRVAELDNRSILSFSDAHSLPNLGRELTVIDANIEGGYLELWKAIKDNSLIGSYEFFPEEGKYHYTGHRLCNVKYNPQMTKQYGVICPVCKRSLTVGVLERVEDLANRSEQDLEIIKDQDGYIKSKKFTNRAGYKMLVPLLQIISEALHTGVASKKVVSEYNKLITSLGGELNILNKIDIKEIEKVSGKKVAEGVDRVRKGELSIDPGFDGVYGKVKIWSDEELKKSKKSQLGLFD